MPRSEWKVGAWRLVVLVFFGLGVWNVSAAPGSLVEAFAPVFQSTPKPWVAATAVQEDGQVFVGGEFVSMDGLHRSLARLKPDGTIDTTFRATNLSGRIFAIVLQPNGKVLVGGFFTCSEGTTVRENLARFNSDGTLDTSFAPPRPDQSVYAISRLKDGSIVIGGWFTRLGATARPAVAKLNSNGALDTSFQPVLDSSDQRISRLIVDSSERIYYLGGANRVVRLTAEGSVDPTFSTLLPANADYDRLTAICLDREGRILVSGEFPSAAGPGSPRLLRLLADGKADPSFNPPSTLISVSAITVQGDGRILVSVAWRTPFRVVRLFEDGSVDPTFAVAPTGGSHAHADDLTIAPDNTLIVAGEFSALDGLPRPGIGRLLLGANPGAFRFNVGTTATAAESDGELLVTVSRFDGADGAASIRYTTEADSALAGEDFTATSGMLEFADGETTKSFAIPLVNDERYEYGETFKVRLSDPIGGFLLNAAAQLTITLTSEDPRRPGALQFAASEVTISENDAEAVLTVNRIGGSDEAVQVQFATADGTARAGFDYVATSGTLNFANGETAKEIRFPLIGDQIAEEAQTFTVRLSEPTNGGTLGSPASVTVTITDSDTLELKEFRGTYTGLISSGSAGRVGFVTASLTANGVATGTLLLDGTRVAFRGLLDQDGILTVHLPRRGLPELLLSLRLDTTGEYEHFTGTITEGDTTLELTAERHTFDARRNPAPLAGRYTLVFESDPGNLAAPRGVGYGLVVVGKSGAVRMAGALADGTKITQSAVVSQQGKWPVFSFLYARTGMLAGSVVFTSDNDWDCSGFVDWIRSPKESSRFYPSGFDTQLSISGSRLKTTSGKQLLAMQSGQLRLTGGDLTTDITADVEQTATNRFSIERLPEKVSFKLNPATGLISGRFVHPVTRRATIFQGVALPDENRAAGFFVGPTAGGALHLAVP